MNAEYEIECGKGENAEKRLKQKKRFFRVNSKEPAFLIGVAGFELATSASLRRRSNQAEPHPEDI